jgi:hypothetical protein
MEVTFGIAARRRTQGQLFVLGAGGMRPQPFGLPPPFIGHSGRCDVAA